MKTILIILWLVSISIVSADTSFSVTGTTDQDAINDLKRQAVREYLQKWLGNNKAAQYEKNLTNEIVERFILDYRLSRTETNLPIVMGHIDAQGIRSWIKLSEAKRGGQHLRIGFIYSENLASRKISPSETAEWLEKSGAAQSIFHELSLLSRNIRAQLIPWHFSTPQNVPPKNDVGIKALARSTSDVDIAVWFHQWKCSECAYTQLEVMAYQLTSGRRIYSRSEEIRSTVTQLLPSIRPELERVISSDAARCKSYELTLTDISNYRAFRSIDTWISAFDSIPVATLTRASNHEAQYSICSPLEIDTLTDELIQTHSTGGPTQIQSKSGNEIILRCGG